MRKGSRVAKQLDYCFNGVSCPCKVIAFRVVMLLRAESSLFVVLSAGSYLVQEWRVLVQSDNSISGLDLTECPWL